MGVIGLLCGYAAGTSFALAKSSSADIDLPPEGQQQLGKTVGYLQSGNWSKAAETSELAVAGAPDASTCLAALARMDKYGAQANKARRACLAKALNLATSHEDLEEVAFKARQAGCFDLSKEALDALIGSTTTIAKLNDLAQKANQAALPDVAHIAMEKAYKLVNNQPDALDYARQTHNLGLEDLTRQAFKDMIDDETSVVDMMNLLVVLDQYQMPDMQRYLLKTGLDKAKDTEEMYAVYQNAQKYNQADIVKVAQFRGRKMVLQKKVKAEEDGKLDAETKKNDALPANILKKPSGF
ncbi:MAG: hypothetical protein KGS72_03440 [Cyanobacteria bacterium REEB67]|nr:hypothetical protein [Cyanobacteria bacterium REEB67]